VQAQVGDQIGRRQVLYVRGCASDTFTLMLQGWALVWAGEEAFESELGPWSFMGNAALSQPSYIPDFSSVTSGRCRLLQIERASFVRAEEAVARVRPTLSAMGKALSQLPPALAGAAEEEPVVGEDVPKDTVVCTYTVVVLSFICTHLNILCEVVSAQQLPRPISTPRRVLLPRSQSLDVAGRLGLH
jgi:CRP-like cAMP-binding protein